MAVLLRPAAFAYHAGMLCELAVQNLALAASARGLGASVRPVTLPPIEQFDDVKKIIAISELFTIHAADLRTLMERWKPVL